MFHSIGRLIVVLLGIQSVVSETVNDGIPESVVSSSGSGQLSLSVAHSLDHGASWGQRGTIILPSARAGSGVAATMDSEDMDGNMLLSHLRDLCSTDSMYLLRISSDEGEVRTATHACNLADSGLRDVFTVHLDWRNKVVGVSILPGESTGGSTSTSDIGFRTKVLMQHMEPGPQPDTAAFIQRVEQEKLAKERGETKDNRSFLAKYWMYIIPVVLVMALSGGEGGGNGGGR